METALGSSVELQMKGTCAVLFEGLLLDGMKGLTKGDFFTVQLPIERTIKRR